MNAGTPRRFSTHCFPSRLEEERALVNLELPRLCRARMGKGWAGPQGNEDLWPRFLVLGLYTELAGRGAGKVHDPPDLTQASSAKASREDAVLTHTQLLPGVVERKRSEGRNPGSEEPAGGRASRRPGTQALSFAEVKRSSRSWIWAPQSQKNEAQTAGGAS